MSALLSLLTSPPKEVAWSDLVEFSRIDERRSSIDCLFPNILGVNDGFVEWCPNDNPPSQAETLVWLWFVRPDLGPEIAELAEPPLRNLIQMYRAGEMEAWWKHISGNAA
jgi:hypothetical protein